MQRVSKITIEVLKKVSENESVERDHVMYGDLNELHEIYERCGVRLKNEHPLNIHQYVLNALDRESKRPDALFIKEYFRSHKGLARVFTIKKDEPEACN